MDWFSAKYPGTFDKIYRPRYEYWRQLEKEGKPFRNPNLPQLCQTCQWPMLFTEPDDPTQICYRETEYKEQKFHFCSDGCKDIFCDEPEKFVNAWLPVHQIFQGNCFPEGADPTAPDFNPLVEALKYMGIKPGVDGGDLRTSADAQRWEEWTGRPYNINEGMATEPPAKAA
jgi:phenol hydroxylase P3 protein